MQAFFIMKTHYSLCSFFLELTTIKLTTITKKRIVSIVLVTKLSKTFNTPVEKIPIPSKPQSIKDCLSDNILNSSIIAWSNTV